MGNQGGFRARQRETIPLVFFVAYLWDTLPVLMLTPCKQPAHVMSNSESLPNRQTWQGIPVSRPGLSSP